MTTIMIFKEMGKGPSARPHQILGKSGRETKASKAAVRCNYVSAPPNAFIRMGERMNFSIIYVVMPNSSV